MSVSLSNAMVCFIACHGGPADHFATYADALIQQGLDVHIFATGPALKKFQDRKVEVKSPFSLDNLDSEKEDELAKGIAKTFAASVATMMVITDVGHAFDIKLQKALKKYTFLAPHYAYYDNPEPFVPGGYSSTAAQVMQIAKGVFFANATLPFDKLYSEDKKEIDLTNKKLVGIGYYPVTQAETIAEKRKSEHKSERVAFLMKNNMKDTGQKVWVYFGGNNEEYFSSAFPAFLSLLAESAEVIDLKNKVIVIQQHPGAKAKNLDGLQVSAWLEKFGNHPNMPKVIMSDFSTDYAQIIAEAALYYQTSMGPQFLLEGIPTIQVGHKTNEDILYRNLLAPSAIKVTEFVSCIELLEKGILGHSSKETILSALGVKPDWPIILEKAIFAAQHYL
jgi:hypothetical protein